MPTAHPHIRFAPKSYLQYLDQDPRPVAVIVKCYPQISILGFAVLYGLMILFAKLSLLLLYLHVVSPDRATRYFIYFGIAAVLLVYVSVDVAIGVLCVPRNGQSQIEVSSPDACLQNAVSTGFVYGIFNALGDLYPFFLPLSVVWKLQIPRKKKIGVYAIFTLGLLGVVWEGLEGLFLKGY